jgi:hypothetical protein
MKTIRLVLVACSVLATAATGGSEEKAAGIVVIAPIGVVAESCPDYHFSEIAAATEYEIAFDFPRQGYGCDAAHFITAPFKGTKSYTPHGTCSSNPQEIGCSSVARGAGAA